MKKYTHCERCGKPKTLPKGKQRYVAQEVYEADPYCSRACVEAAFGIKTHRGPYTRDYAVA